MVVFFCGVWGRGRMGMEVVLEEREYEEREEKDREVKKEKTLWEME